MTKKNDAISHWAFRYVILPPESQLDSKKKSKLLKNGPADGDAREILKSLYHRKIYQIFKKKLRFKHLTSIQRAVLPLISQLSIFDLTSPNSSDIVVTAPTGQGKTLCYVIPIISSLLYNPISAIRAIIIAPTRELVNQILKVFSVFCSESPSIRVTSLAANKPFSVEVADLRGKDNDVPMSNIVIATPGRFVEHYQGEYSVSSAAVINELCANALSEPPEDDDIWRMTQWIVLDEADKLMEQAYSAWIQQLNILINRCRSSPRKVIASATMTQNPEKLNILGLSRAIFFLTSEFEGTYSLPLELRQYFILSPKFANKNLTLLYLLHQLYISNENKKIVPSNSPPMKKHKKNEIAKRIKTVVFCGSKHSVRNLSKLLTLYFSSSTVDCYPDNVTPLLMDKTTIDENVILSSSSPLNLNVETFSSSLSQKERTNVVSRFGTIHSGKSNEIDILVCSDVLARGLDLPTLNVVINFDSPKNIRSYVHRAGRTARAGKHGIIFTLLDQEELPPFSSLLKKNKLTGNNEDVITLWDLVMQHGQEKNHIREWIAKMKSKKCELSKFLIENI